MNGAHDIGGAGGLGPIDPGKDGLVFHDDWERTVFAMFVAVSATGLFNVDEFRHSIEQMPAEAYNSTSYYEKWLHAIEYICAAKGVMSPADVAARVAALKEAGHERSH